jgi:hypothetical protein
VSNFDLSSFNYYIGCVLADQDLKTTFTCRPCNYTLRPTSE